QDLYNDDVGNAALFLSSELSRVITGTTMLDGGASPAHSVFDLAS
ncbi:unnamed protein product, partial [Laminaria digitata]